MIGDQLGGHPQKFKILGAPGWAWLDVDLPPSTSPHNRPPHGHPSPLCCQGSRFLLPTQRDSRGASHSSVIPTPGSPLQCPQHSTCLPPPTLSPPAFALVSLGNSLEPGEALKGKMVLDGQILPTTGPPIPALQGWGCCQGEGVGEILGDMVA